MTRYAVNQPFTLSTVVSTAGVLVDPTDISLTTLSTVDGVSTTYAYNPGTIVRDNVGRFHLDFAGITAVGHYAYTWTPTGTDVHATPLIGTFDVYSPFALSVVSIDDAREYLRMVDGTDVTADDDRLAVIIGSVTDGLARLVGPLVPTTYTETLRAAGNCIQLGHGPVRSVTSLTGVPSGFVVTPGDLATLPGDVITPRSGAMLSGWYTVVYSAGPDSIANDVRGAALDWILHRWRQAQAHGSATYGELTGDFAGPPNAVMNQVRHYLLTRSGA